MTIDRERLFWEKYFPKSATYHISPKAWRYYPQHVERYIRAHDGVRLAHHTPDHLTSYLEGMAKTARLPAWRFRQIVDALRILFLEMVRAPWARVYPWDVWEARQEPAGRVPNKMRNERRLQQTQQNGEPIRRLDPDSRSGVTATAYQHLGHLSVRVDVAPMIWDSHRH